VAVLKLRTKQADLLKLWGQTDPNTPWSRYQGQMDKVLHPPAALTTTTAIFPTSVHSHGRTAATSTVPGLRRNSQPNQNLKPGPPPPVVITGVNTRRNVGSPNMVVDDPGGAQGVAPVGPDNAGVVPVLNIEDSTTTNDLLTHLSSASHGAPLLASALMLGSVSAMFTARPDDWSSIRNLLGGGRLTDEQKRSMDQLMSDDRFFAKMSLAAPRTPFSETLENVTDKMFSQAFGPTTRVGVARREDANTQASVNGSAWVHQAGEQLASRQAEKFAEGILADRRSGLEQEALSLERDEKGNPIPIRAPHLRGPSNV
jgi:hypothetical protein